MTEIIPAILTSDYNDLQKKLEAAEDFGASRIQIDLTDGRFVDSKTISTAQLAQIRSEIELEVHLMVSNPLFYLEAAKYCRPRTVIVQIESIRDPEYFARMIHRKGTEAGLAFNPETSIAEIKPWFDYFDLIMFLSVRPGRQGNQFFPFVLEKIKQFREEFPDTRIGIDGGINIENIGEISDLGLSEIVVGSGIWKSRDPAGMYRQLQRLIQ